MLAPGVKSDRKTPSTGAIRLVTARECPKHPIPAKGMNTKVITISLCMIVKDEEQTLARCLDSAKNVVDEIIIVDTGSKDKTKKIAKKYTPHVYTFDWIDDFSAARNFSFSKATMEYCMWLDADDILTPEDQAAFLELKRTVSNTVDVIMMKYNTSFDAAGNPTFSYYRERLLRNHAGFVWAGAVHETIPPRGDILYSDIAVTHRKLGKGDPDRNLRIYESLIEKGVPLNPREQFYYAKELYYHGRFGDAGQALEAYLDSGRGWVENEIDACLHLSICHRSLGEKKQALSALFRSFSYDVPRAEICCAIGRYFMEERAYATAVFWYELATTRPRNDRSGAFVSPDCYGFIPYLQLCVCYDHLGDHVKAEHYNELAGEIKPDDPSVQSNRAYFASRKVSASNKE